MLDVMTPTAQAWDTFVESHPRAHVLQQSAWGDLKSAYGWQADRVALTSNDQIVAGAQLLFRALPFHLGTMAYLPMGGYVTGDKNVAFDQWPELWRAVDQCAKRHRAAFLKWEPGIYRSGSQPDFTLLRISRKRADHSAAQHHPDRPQRQRR